MSNFQRRDFLTGAAAFAVGATATPVGARQAGAGDQPPVPIRGKEGRPDHRSDEPLARSPERGQACPTADRPRHDV